KAGPSTALAGTNVTYDIAVTNNGPSDARSVAVTDALPAGVTLVSQSRSGTLGTLTPGASVAIQIIGHVAASVANGTSLTNVASVSTATTDPSPANNSASVA